MRFKFCTIALLALLGCAAENDLQAATCAVYQSFYEYWPVEARPQLRFARQTLNPRTAPDRAPISFKPGLIVDPNNMDPETFSEDTSAYFDQLRSDVAAVSDCFPDGGPTFIDESDVNDGALGWTWTLSPVAVAPNGQQALLMAVNSGGEYYILFERQRSEWILTGHANGRIF